MKIISATYGGVDVKDIVESKIKGDALVLRASNSIFGDTSVGNVKFLEIKAELNGEIYHKLIKEGNLAVIPESNNTKLGIFYSNNTNQTIYPAIRASLKSIQKAAEGVADIYTCMWLPEIENPFREMIAWTQTQSHLNQLLQIMQLLYSAREVKQYEYVSFLEHDVLYGEGYFDYPQFEGGKVLTNMNYMGICGDGYQPLGQRDEPFHQMTMRFDDAILHCQDILANALITNSGMIEPQTLERIQWESPNSSIHINHGHHFTSHYNVYRKDAMYWEHPYWGNHSEWLYLFGK
jgi:hypothetical protein